MWDSFDGAYGFSSIHHCIALRLSLMAAKSTFLACAMLCWTIIHVSRCWKTCIFAYIFVVISWSFILNFSMHSMNALMFSLSLSSCLTSSSISLIMSSFSWFSHTNSLRFYLDTNVKATLADTIESGPFLTFSVRVVLVTIGSGAFPVTGRILDFCCTIIFEALSNLKVFKLETLWALEGVNNPSPSSPSRKCPPMSGASIKDPKISVSMGDA